MLKDLKFDLPLAELPTESQILETEEKLGMKLPDAFREFCRRFNGGFTNAENMVYKVPDKFREFHEEYQEGEVMVDILYGITPPGLPQCNLLENGVSSVAEFGILPVSEDLFGNAVVIKKDAPKGLVYFRDHELWEPPDQIKPYLIPIADTLEDFYNSLTLRLYDDE